MCLTGVPPSLTNIRGLRSSRESGAISAATEKGGWVGEEEGRETKLEDGWARWKLYITFSSPPCGLSTLPFQIPKLDF